MKRSVLCHVLRLHKKEGAEGLEATVCRRHVILPPILHKGGL